MSLRTPRKLATVPTQVWMMRPRGTRFERAAAYLGELTAFMQDIARDSHVFEVEER